jgi:hypothetical protein
MMKQFFLLTSIMLATFFTAFGQDDPAVQLPPSSAPVADEALSQGNWVVGGGVGSIGFNFSSGTFALNLVPHAGYFISNNLALGAQTTLELTAYDGGTNFSYGISPFLRYYFGAGGRASGRFFGELGAGLAGSSLVDNNSDTGFSGLLNLRAGYAHFITRNVALEGSLGYNLSGADLQSVNAVSGLGLIFGFQIYLPGSRNR